MEKPFVDVARSIRQARVQYESMEEALEQIGSELGVRPNEIIPTIRSLPQGQGDGGAQGLDCRALQRQCRSAGPGGRPEPEAGGSRGACGSSGGRVDPGRGGQHKVARRLPEGL